MLPVRPEGTGLPGGREEQAAATRHDRRRTVSEDRPTVAQRRAQYAEWRSRMQSEKAELKALATQPEQRGPALSSEWSPEVLFEDSRSAD